MHGAVYQEITLYCERYSMPEMWARIGAPVECFRSPRDGARVVERLGWEFTESDLISAGVAELTLNGLSISRTLGDADRVLVVLREFDGTQPFAILSSTGLLGAQASPFACSLQMVRDHELAIQSDRRVFLAFSMDDLIALRSVGLVCIMAAGILECDHEQLQELCTLCGWLDAGVADILARDPAEPLESNEAEKEGDEGQIADATPASSDTQNPDSAANQFDLILVGWFPATISVQAPAPLLSIVNFLSRVERCLRCNLSNVAVWQPNSQAAEEIQFALEHGNREAVCRIIRDSVSESALTVDRYMDHVSRGDTSKDFSAATTEVFRLVRENHQGRHQQHRVQAAVDALGEMMHRELVVPVLDQAIASDDVFTRIELVLLANLTGVTHQQGLAVHRALARWTPNGIDAQGREEIRAYLATVDRFRAIAAGIRRS